MNLLARHPQSGDLLLLPPRDTPYLLRDVLEKMVYGCRDELILNLGDCFLQFKADSDTDTIASRFEPLPFRAKKGYRSIQSAKPWKKYLGKECGWIWLAWNQEGYLDSVLLGLDGIEPTVLLQAIASSIDIFTISLVKPRSASSPVKGAKHKTNGKR